eukprot:scaffold182856_cov22-Tisochrysis_lutea.AAC.1
MASVCLHEPRPCSVVHVLPSDSSASTPQMAHQTSLTWTIRKGSLASVIILASAEGQTACSSVDGSWSAAKAAALIGRQAGRCGERAGAGGLSL